MKRIHIAQAERVNWKKELRRYVTKYRSIDHTTIRKSPADCHLNLQTWDRDAEVKAKTKAYADKAVNAKPSDITVGDQVLVRREKRQVLDTI